MVRHKFRATIAPKVLQRKTYRNRGHRTRAEELELDHGEVTRMLNRLPGRPFLYNHKDKIQIGSVLASFRHPKDGSWLVDYQIDDSTPHGKSALYWVAEGGMSGVSLQHIPGDDLPLEVSACWRGARGPESVTHTDPSDPRHISKTIQASLLSGSNTIAGYGTESARTESFYRSILASADADDSYHATDCESLFCSVTRMDAVPSNGAIAASTGSDQAAAAAAAMPTGSAAAAPAAPAAAATAPSKSTLLPGAAKNASPPAGLSAGPATKGFVTKDGRTVNFTAKPRASKTGQAQPAHLQKHQFQRRSAATAPSPDTDMQDAEDDGDEGKESDIMRTLEQQHEEWNTLMSDPTAPFTADKLKSLHAHIQGRDHTVVQIEAERMRLSHELDALRAEKTARDQAEMQATTEREQKQAEADHAEKLLDAKIAMDFMATFEPNSTEEERAEYHRSLMSMPIATVRTMLRGKKEALEKTKRENSSASAGHMNELRDKYRNLTAPYSTPGKMLPNGFTDTLSNSSYSPPANGGGGAPAVAASDTTPYMGQSWASSAQSDTKEPWDPIAWASMEAPPVLGPDSAYVQGTRARSIMASYTTDTSVYKSEQDRADEPNERVIFVNGVRVKHKSISAAAESEKRAVSIHQRKGEGARFPFKHIDKHLRLATAAVWQGDTYWSAPKVQASDGPENLYSASFLPTYYAYTKQNAVHQDYGNDQPSGTPMQR